MQTFVLAQALVEHSALSSMTTGIGNAFYELSVFFDGLSTTQIVVVGIAVVAVLVFWLRR